MAYVDGFLAAVPIANRDAFIAHAKQFGDVLREFGALNVTDCWGSDIPEGKVTSFPLAVQCKEDETVTFSWVVWPDKTTRDAAWEKMQTDPRFSSENNPMPFDGKRIVYGGFDIVYQN